MFREAFKAIVFPEREQFQDGVRGVKTSRLGIIIRSFGSWQVTRLKKDDIDGDNDDDKDNLR